MHTSQNFSQPAVHLQCSEPSCGETSEWSDRALRCTRCGDWLEVVVSPAPIDPLTLIDRWRSRRLSLDPRDASGVWR